MPIPLLPSFLSCCIVNDVMKQERRLAWRDGLNSLNLKKASPLHLLMVHPLSQLLDIASAYYLPDTTESARTTTLFLNLGYPYYNNVVSLDKPPSSS